MPRRPVLFLLLGVWLAACSGGGTPASEDRPAAPATAPPAAGASVAPTPTAAPGASGPERGEDGVRGLVDVGGHRLYIECRGTGGPTVVLDAGGSGSSSVWSGVQPQVAAFARACAYDRANRGKSDRVPAPNDAAAMVRDLRALLAAAGVPGPYVLVGHSYGGLVAQLYAATHPEQVAGLVLVESSHPDYYVANRDYYTANAARFDIDLLASAEQAALAGPWPAVPLAVLSRGKPFPAIPGGEEPWAAGQAALAARLPDSTHRVVADADHNIPAQQPQAIVDAIRAVTAAAPR